MNRTGPGTPRLRLVMVALLLSTPCAALCGCRGAAVSQNRTDHGRTGSRDVVKDGVALVGVEAQLH